MFCVSMYQCAAGGIVPLRPWNFRHHGPKLLDSKQLGMGSTLSCRILSGLHMLRGSDARSPLRAPGAQQPRRLRVAWKVGDLARERIPRAKTAQNAEEVGLLPPPPAG